MKHLQDMIGLFVVVNLFIGTSAVSGIDAPKGIGVPTNVSFSYHFNENQDKLVLFQRRGERSKIVDCYIFGDSMLINQVLKIMPKTYQHKEDDHKLMNLINLCEEGKLQGMFSGGIPLNTVVSFGLFSAFFIYPGTKWCGAGNISLSDEDLGEDIEVDRCCRTHDHCSDSIVAFGSNHDLNNRMPMTLSNCNCDEKFYNCLKKTDTKSSNRVGRLYFNVVPLKCFREDYPIKSCKKYSELLPPRCEEYEFDTEKEPVYEFFDDPIFESVSQSTEDSDENQDAFSYLLKLEHENKLTEITGFIEGS